MNEEAYHPLDLLFYWVHIYDAAPHLDIERVLTCVDEPGSMPGSAGHVSHKQVTVSHMTLASGNYK